MHITLFEFITSIFFLSSIPVSITAAYQYDYDWVSRHLGARSPYNQEAGGSSDSILNEYDIEQIQIVFRHGTRQPNEGDKEDMVRLAQVLSTSNNDTVSWASKFNPGDYPDDQFDQLTKNGERELYEMGARMGKKYAGLRSQLVEDDKGLAHLKNIASDHSRTVLSGTQFTKGFFEGSGVDNVPMTKISAEQDTTIYSITNCPEHGEEVGKTPKKEMHKYLDKAYPSSAERINADLGVQISARDVYYISLSCAYEASIYHRVDTFCSLLTKKDFAISEYAFDIKYSHKYSYPFPINSLLACDLVKEIAADLDSGFQGNQDAPLLSLKHGHSMTVLSLADRLGIHKDDFLLKADASQDQIDSRLFRTSEDDMYGANIMFQLLSKKGTKDKFVRILLSEVPTVLPGCDSEVCPYETFRNVVEPLLQCNREQACNGGAQR
ncbi:histidine phosphatase superfamily [Zychaea mexicana]|uniref:histidine phosphatase superfamily n=1 Tax=Zychaea mexicana TaxID=64656 RepID=UPI0022FE063A|nr:histidine phosphatase superfamily [Zychaea mexicana]KAI9497472.1 histidine phosphatase superfamily [Zychaea mexicana]